MRIIDLHTALVQLRDDGILHLHLKSRMDVRMQDANEILRAMKAIGGGAKFPVLIDAGEFTRIDPDVRAFSASEEGNIYTLADAIAYNSLAQKLVANFYVTHDKPVVPTRTFAHQQEAIAWLKSFVKVVT